MFINFATRAKARQFAAKRKAIGYNVSVKDNGAQSVSKAGSRYSVSCSKNIACKAV